MELTKENIIRMLAERCDFSLGDVRIILDELINIFEESIKSKTIINIRGLGKLDYFSIAPREGSGLVSKNAIPKGEKILWKGKEITSDGKLLPSGTKIVFSLAKNLKAALKEKGFENDE